MNTRLLIIDDETSLLEFLELLFKEQGYSVTTANCVEDARGCLASDSFDLVLCDITMPDGSGLDLLREMKQQRDERTAVIMMTAYTSTESAIEAMKLGAYDYVSKPFDVDELKVIAQRAVEKSELWSPRTSICGKRARREATTSSNIVGRSRRMQEIFALVERVAKTPPRRC